MGIETIEALGEEKFKEIYTNEELRNAVAFAHGCYSSDNKFLHKKALMHPISYSVSEDQITEAKNLRTKRAKEVLRDNHHKLLFVGMGMSFKPSIKDGVGNYRIRTHFINNDGVKCFIEFGNVKDTLVRIDHAIFNYKGSEEKNNYKKLERNTPTLKYTFKNVLRVVNEYFNCSFKEAVLDDYNISCDGVLCESPKE